MYFCQVQHKALTHQVIFNGKTLTIALVYFKLISTSTNVSVFEFN